MYRKKVYMPDGISSHYHDEDGNGNKLNLSYFFAEELGKIHVTESVFIDSVELHTHEFVEIVCVTEGCGIHYIDGESIRVRRGDIFLIDYGVSHTYESMTEPFCWINIIFRPEFLGGDYPVLTNALQLLSYLRDHRLQPIPDISLCRQNLRSDDWDGAVFFEDMLREYNNRASDYSSVLEHMLSILLIRLSRQFFVQLKQENTPFDRILPDIIRQLNQNLPVDISARVLAEKYFMSPSAFSTHFQRAMGCSFRDYVTNLRIRHACALLLTTDSPVGDIQSRCGYNDSKSFYKAFRRYMDMTPIEYRKSKHTEEAENEIDPIQ